MRELAALPVRRGEELLGEEGIALCPRGDRVRQHCRQRGAGVGHEQRRQLLVRKRPEVKRERRGGAQDAVGEFADTLDRLELVRTVRHKEQNPLVAEVVRKEDDEIECRCIRPMEILEHEQHGHRRRALGEQREGLLEHPQL
jgi:hypothetical protein